MQSSNIPTKIPLPFAYAASSTYKNTIPTASQIGIVSGRASLTDGFPPLTFTPVTAGGVPPFGGDMNGILNEITAIQQWQEAGGMFPFDAGFATTIGGYPKGAVILSSSFNGLWISTIENNSNNPDTTGTGWVSFSFEGLQSVAMATSSVTLTQLQSAYPIINITGTLTANSTLTFPAQVGEWILVNNTTGAFTLTAKTASGTGVTLTQAASTYVYGDGTNMYFADSAKVASFNGRTGTVTLTATDVTNALGYVPPTPTGGGASGTWNINISGNSATTSQTNFTNLTIGGSQVIDAANYLTYSPSLTGNGASGTWNINITGNANTVTYPFPSGTRLVFSQSAAPTGWTQDVSDTANNRMMRVVASAGNGVGGSYDPTVMNVVPSHTHSFATGNENAYHTHYDSGHSHRPAAGTQFVVNPNWDGAGGNLATGGLNASYDGGTTTASSYANLGSQSVFHQHSGSTDNGSSQTNWTPRYVNLIICQKN